MDRRLSPADVPARFLSSVFLTGRIPWRVAPLDPRVAYGMYIPETETKTETKTETSDEATLPLVVFVHGTGRDVAALTTDLPVFAEAHGCAVLAPLFPAGLDGPNDLDAYKTLRSATLAADRVLLAILDEVGAVWPPIATERIHLLGFSGGGQFVQRLLYVYPERVAAASIGAPGRPTWLDKAAAWPAGIANAKAIFGREVASERIREVPMHYVVGSLDNEMPGGGDFWAWLQELREKANQSKNNVHGLPTVFHGRLNTARKLHEHWKGLGIDSQLEVVDGAAHEGSLLRRHQLRFLASRLVRVPRMKIG